MTVNQVSVFIENRQGRLGEVLQVLKDNDVNILSISLADTTEYGLLRLIVNKPEQTEQVEGQTENIVVDDAEIGGEAVEIDLDDATDAGEEADAQAGEEDAE